MWGYYDLIAKLSDPKHPQHEETKEWLGGGFDPAEFDLDRVNAVLKGLRA